MKNLKYIILYLGAILFTSCLEEQEIGKDIEVTPGNGEIMIKAVENSYTSFDGFCNLKINTSKNIRSLVKLTLDSADGKGAYFTINNPTSDIKIMASNLKYTDNEGDLLNIPIKGSTVGTLYYKRTLDGIIKTIKLKINHLPTFTVYDVPQLNNWDKSIDNVAVNDKSKFKIKYQVSPKFIDESKVIIKLKYKIYKKIGTNVNATVIKTSTGHIDSLLFDMTDHKFQGTILNKEDTLSFKLVVFIEGTNQMDSTEWKNIVISDRKISTPPTTFEFKKYIGQYNGTEGDSVAFDLIKGKNFSFNRDDIKVKNQIDTSGVWAGNDKIYFGSKIEVAETGATPNASYRNLTSLTYTANNLGVTVTEEDQTIAFKIFDSKGNFKYGIITAKDVINKDGTKNDKITYSYKIEEIKL